ncbi:MAG: nucleoside triphosphate pyrophosphohydrolase [Chromatiales bacterium]|jgi:ATP diphosphatase|nr:nucleoside triphosphate pyrophosphohydrolase [Chromatiales bacterium]
MNNNIENLLQIMRSLRHPETGCPWDIKQTFASIAPYTIEEAYEVAEAIDQADLQALKGELGDLLFQVVFYAQMAAEQGAFEFNDVVEAISEKLTRRHPHVFTDALAGNEIELHRDWESHKVAEQREQYNNDTSILAGVPKAVPALKRAAKLDKRAASQGFDWGNAEGVLNKIAEEAAEVCEALEGDDPARIQEEYGDLLLAVTSLGRHLKADPEEALRQASNKFEARIRGMETLMQRGDNEWNSYDLDGLEALWEQAKSSEKER